MLTQPSGADRRPVSLSTLSCSLLPCLLTSGLSAQMWFHAPQSVEAGYEHSAAGDLDGDGNVDLILENGTTIAVRLGQGDGTFVAGPSFPRPANWNGSSTLVDLDADGWLDLVSLRNPTGLLFLPGQTGATFGAAIAVPTPEVNSRLAIGDGNGDGIADLAVQGFNPFLGGPVVRWILGDTNRQFTVLPVVAFPNADPKGLVTFDGNGDGFDDIALTSRYSVLTGFTQSGGTINTGPVVAVTDLDSWIVAVDLDGDSDDDLLVASGARQLRLTTITNNGGTFAASEQTLSSLRVGQPFATDWDNDGDTDVFLRGFSGLYALLLNDGLGGLTNTWARDYDLPFMLLHPGIHDVNNDGRPDFVDTVALFPGDGAAGTWWANPSLRGLPFEDAEGDGDPDVAVGAIVYTNDGRGVFATEQLTPPVAPLPNGFFGAPIALGDYDGDGWRDALSGLFTTQGGHQATFVQMHRLEEDGAGGFVDHGPAAAPGVAITGNAIAVDTNGDGVLDVVNGNGVWANNGNHSFAQQPTSFAGYTPLEPFDINGDGAIDFLAVQGGAAGGAAVLRQTGGHSFAIDSVYPQGTALGIYSVPALADVDDDGDFDVMVNRSATGQTGQVELWLNQNGVFAAGPVVTFPGFATSSTCLAADIDGDGFTDLALARSRNMHVRLRSGAGLTYDPAVSYLTDNATQFVDIDQDGDPDVVGTHTAPCRRFDGPTAGARRQYGAPGTGTGGFSPVLGCAGVIRSGETPVLRLRRAVGGSLTILTLGYSESNLPSPLIPGLVHYGAPFVATLFFVTSGAPGQQAVGEHDLPIAIPPGFLGLTLYLQHHILDAGSSNDIVHSNGLAFSIGL